MDNSPIRKIIHIDMDAFYASIEQRDRPELRGKPVIVGGSPHSRGVVATCSYEARPFGIHSAMASHEAYKRCPQAVFVRGNMQKYREVSKEIMDIFYEITDLVEPLSLDEAYLDVTENKLGYPSATYVAREIRKRIKEKTGLNASAGVSYNKFLAKIASDYEKPDGLTVVTPDKASAFIHELPIGDFRGVGKSTKETFLEMGVQTGADLLKWSEEDLVRIFHKRGHTFYNNSRGIDEREVNPYRERKSMGRETTLPHNISEYEDMLPIVKDLLQEVLSRLQTDQIRVKCVVLKVKFYDFKQITRRTTLDEPTDDQEILLAALGAQLEHIASLGREVRLLGVTTSDFHGAGDASGGRGKVYKTTRYEQLRLF